MVLHSPVELSGVLSGKPQAPNERGVAPRDTQILSFKRPLQSSLYYTYIYILYSCCITLYYVVSCCIMLFSVILNDPERGR